MQRFRPLVCTRRYSQHAFFEKVKELESQLAHVQKLESELALVKRQAVATSWIAYLAFGISVWNTVSD